VLNALFTQGFISMNFYKNNVSLDSLFIRLNEGSIHAGGTTGYKKGEITHIDMRASIDDVKLNRPKEYSLTVRSGQLTCRNQDGYYQIDGAVVLGETRLQYGFGPKDILSFTQKVERPAQEPGLFKQRVRMNIQIRESKDIWVDNNLARLRLHPELSFIGNLAHPNVTGRLTVDDGYILYLDRKFDVKHGVIDFIDPDRLNPVVDFQAESDIKTYQTLGKIPYVVTLAITGSLDHAQIDLTSNPPLDKPDIIALLTLGATRDQLTIRKSGGSDVSINDILKERAEMLSSRKISNYVSRRLGNIFGLEDISIEGNLFNIGRSSGPQIFASEKITNKMSINYTTAVGHSNEQSIRLDYRLSKYFSFEGQTDQRGQSGIDAKYRIKFK